MNLFKKLAVGATLALTFGAASATFVGTSSEQTLQSIINGLYTAAGTSTTGAPDVNANQYAPDERWQVEASGQTAATFIIEITSLSSSNTFGVYSLTNPGTKVQLFGGSATAAYKANLAINESGGGSVTYLNASSAIIGSDNFADGTLVNGQFGYYLGVGSSSPQSFWYSEESLNGGSDQMVAYQGDGDTIKLPGQNAGTWGSSSFILAWEDTAYANSDKDFNDLVLYVESVTGVPEPTTLALVGLSMAALGALTRRRRNA